MLNKIINGVFWATIAIVPIMAVCMLVLAYLNIGIKEGYTQAYAIGYSWVYMAISVVYDVFMVSTTKKASKIS